MALTLNANEARKADSLSTVIKESGKYVGVITRAEKLLSKNKVEGLGLSFKTDDNASANYLDVYTVKENGELLRGHAIAQAVLCCTRVKNAADGNITFDRWDNNERKMVKAVAQGYPDLMGKRIGLVLQREIGTNGNTGEDTDRLNIVAVFEASTGLTASEILDSKTKPERIDAIAKMIEANPVRDTRKRAPARTASSSGHSSLPPAGDGGFDDDIPF